MTQALPTLSVLVGIAIVAYALQTAIRTFALPQPGLSLLSRVVFRSVQPIFDAVDRLPAPPGRRGAWASVYAPLCMMLIVFLAIVLIGIGFTLILYGLGMPTLLAALSPASRPCPRWALPTWEIAPPSKSWRRSKR